MGIKLRNLSVLVVDGSPQALRIMKMVLSGLHVSQISTAKDGIRAREIVAQAENEIDVVICDWKIPGMTGLELLKEVRNSNPNILFMMATENVDAESVLAAKEAGVDAFIAKPVTADQVEKKLLVLTGRL